MKTFTSWIWIFLTGNRMKSFYWRTGAMFATVITATLADSGLTGYLVVIIGLLMGEVTKAINKKVSETLVSTGNIK